jgi:lipopolysaccharide assembly outer membrane protein LptD (OstA)
LFKNVFKNILQISIILIFNNFLAQSNTKNGSENKAIVDTIRKSDTIVVKKESLEDIFHSKADNTRYDVIHNISYLNKNAHVTYQGMQIDADYISVNMNTGIIFARGELDENGRITKPAIATQDGKKYEYDQFSYSYKTKQAVAFNARTEESEGVIVAEKTKKYNDSVYFMRRGKYTTDEYFLKKKDTIADYYLLAPHIKLLKGKNSSQIITGPIQMYIEQVPTPLALPFAVLPFSSKRSAGIIIPSFGERQDVGFYLSGLGYYQPIGEHFDFKVASDIYTKGSWGIRPELNYRKIYKYQGNFSADIGTTVRGIKGLSNYSKSSTFRIAWRHSQDQKANPFLNFSASVDITSSKFYNNTMNNNYLFNQSTLNAQQNSSVNLTKRFLTLPITITAAASYSQNFQTGNTSLRLPDMNVSMNQFYIFKPKTGTRTGLLENIAVNTGLSLSNSVNNVSQNEMFTKTMWNNMQTGVKNNITVGTNTPIAKYFTFSLNANIDNVLTTKTLTRFYNPISNTVDNIYNKNIAGFSTFSTSASLQTILYGMLKFNKNSKIQAIRHMVTPSFSVTYSPNFTDPKWGYFRSYHNDVGNSVLYSIFEGGVYGVPSSSGLVQSVGFNIGNNLEMKVHSKTDSTGVKKLKIFENLNVTGSYNFAAKDHPWSLFNVNAQSSFLNNKLSVNTSLVLEPYQILFTPDSNTGIRTENFGHFSVQTFNVQFSVPLSNELFGKKTDYATKYNTKGEIRNENYFFDDDNYAHFQQSWTLNVNANYAYTRNLSRLGTKVAAVGLNGNINLTPFWAITGSTNYDFVSKKLAYTTLGFARDQRSFTINFNWVPFGQNKVYDFFIGIKANILKDAVKYKDRSFTQPNPPPF